jgi:glycerol uptake facilitator-like aquaporin
VLAIGMTYGLNAGYAINPARDFGPRLFTYLAGWGSQVFTAYNNWWWVPIVGPLCGGVLGGFVYDLLVTKLHPSERD